MYRGIEDGKTGSGDTMSRIYSTSKPASEWNLVCLPSLELEIDSSLALTT